MELINEIKLLLGHPLRQVELTDEMIISAGKIAKDMFIVASQNNKLYSKEYQESWIKLYTIATCKEILSNIRGKFSGVIGPPENLQTMEYKDLLKVAIIDKEILTNILNK